jgi:DNA anti-recombination protein RmuC
LLAQRIGLLEQQRLLHAAANEWDRANAILDEMQRLTDRVESWQQEQGRMRQEISSILAATRGRRRFVLARKSTSTAHQTAAGYLRRSLWCGNDG